MKLFQTLYNKVVLRPLFQVVAEQALKKGSECGHWVILQNIHLVAKWLSTLEKEMEKFSEESHENFRVFISAEPAPTAESHIIPQVHKTYS